VSKLKKLEEEGRSPTKREESKEEKGKCKFILSDHGCRRGKTCSWSHDQKDDKRRCRTCECPDHMSPACPRPKDRNDQSLQKPKIQKAEGEETSSPTSSTKGKEEEMSSETASMIHLLLKSIHHLVLGLGGTCSSA
jgi:TFIIF-interacting CTD phosphatase-like protein